MHRLALSCQACYIFNYHKSQKIRLPLLIQGQLGGHALAMKKNSTFVYIGAFALFAIATGLLCAAGFNEGSVYFLNVAEARQAPPEKLRQVRLFGLVAPDSMIRQPSVLSFHLADKDDSKQAIPVNYSGVIPDTLKDGAEVIVEGSLLPDGKFSAKTLMTKCPSKYQKENRKI